MKESDCIIDVHNIKKSYSGKIAVHDFSLTAKKGEIVGFLGPNGSGKTTIIKILCGLLTPDEGKGFCMGYDLIQESHLIRKNIGYMTQSFSLYPYLTIYQNLDFIAKITHTKNRKKCITELVEQMNLGKRLHQKAASLSGGWKQRLALAACILHSPKLLLLDEPTAGVDPKARHDFWKIINELAANGMTFLISTHYMDEAERCDKIIYLAYGKVIAKGNVREISREANLSVWVVRGRELAALGSVLQELDGVEEIIHKGSFLHVIGHDKLKLVKSLRPYLLDLNYFWEGIEPDLDDVFVELMSGIKDERFD